MHLCSKFQFRSEKTNRTDPKPKAAVLYIVCAICPWLDLVSIVFLHSIQYFFFVLSSLGNHCKWGLVFWWTVDVEKSIIVVLPSLSMIKDKTEVKITLFLLTQ